MINQEDKAETIGISFNIIKDWVQGHLKTENGLIFCNNKERKVIVNTLNGNKIIEIPIKHSPDDSVWAKSWIQVYQTCLDALEEKVQFLCFNDSIVTLVKENQVKIGNVLVVLPDNTDDISYINALEKIIKTYDVEKAKEQQLKKEKPFKVNYQTIQIEKPSLNFNNNEDQSVVSGRLPISEQETEPDKKETKARKKIIVQKVPDNDVLKQMDCSRFRENEEPFVLVTCSDLNKGEGTFIDNADLCKEENISIGAFIGGKAITKEQGISEAKRIIKLLDNYEIVGPVVYELNNEYINNEKTTLNTVIEIVDIGNEISDILKDKGYKPFICMDLKSSKKIDEANKKRSSYYPKHPKIIRLLPREKEEVSKKESTILIDPVFDYDIVTINNYK